MSVFFVALPFLILMRQRFAAELALASGSGEPRWFVAMEWTLVLGVGAVMFGTIVWAMRRPLTWGESMRVLFGATTKSPGWSEPHIARLLVPEDGVKEPDRDSARDHLRAIEDLVQSAAETNRAVAALALESARALVQHVEGCDAEMASLGAIANDGEIDRLTAQAAEFRDAPAGVTGSASAGELAALVERQLELILQMKDRREVVSQQRGKYMNLLRGVWAHLSAMRETGEMGRLEDLLAEVERETKRAE